MALKGASNANSKLAAQKRMNTETSKENSHKQVTTFESPSKGPRQVHNKTAVVMQDESRGIQPNAIRALNAQPQKAVMGVQHQYNKWADDV